MDISITKTATLNTSVSTLIHNKKSKNKGLIVQDHDSQTATEVFFYKIQEKELGTQ